MSPRTRFPWPPLNLAAVALALALCSALRGVAGQSTTPAAPQCGPGLLLSNGACISCGLGYHVPVGGTGDCSEFQCPANSTDHDNRADTPCLTCGVGHYVPAGSAGSCFSLQCPVGFTDHDRNSTTPCTRCVAGQFAGRASAGECTACRAGTSDVDGDPATQCARCSAGSFAPQGSRVPCISLQCPAGTLDHDQDASTPCIECGRGGFVPQGQAGDDCSAYMCRGGSYDNDNSSATRCVVDVPCGTSVLTIPYFDATTTAAPSTSEPTSTPMSSPSPVPTTVSPTTVPTPVPSAAPAAAPTSLPTTSPTTLQPTFAPTNRSDFCFRNCRQHYPEAQQITTEEDHRYTIVTVVVGIAIAFVLGSVFGVAVTFVCVRPGRGAEGGQDDVSTSTIKVNPLLEQTLDDVLRKQEQAQAPDTPGSTDIATMSLYTSGHRDDPMGNVFFPGDFGSDFGGDPNDPAHLDAVHY